MHFSFFASFVALSVSYDLGEDITLCWVTNVSEEGSTAVREDCGGAYVEFTFSWPDPVYEEDPHQVTYFMYVPASRQPVTEIPHTNIHSCLRKVGFCTPFVANTPTLATHSPEVTGNFTEDGYFYVTNEVTLEAAQYTLISHGRWYDVSGLKHDMSRAVLKDFVPQPEPVHPAVYAVIVLGSVIGLSIICVIACLCRYGIKKYRALMKESLAAFDARKARVVKACKEVGELAFPMCCISYLTFKETDGIITYETARDEYPGSLAIFDNVSDMDHSDRTERIIIFVSHQWYGEGVPDPQKHHYHTIVRAIEGLIIHHDLDPEKVLVWIDYTSIPQRSAPLQRLSIDSLAAYAAQSHFFLVIAPSVVGRGGATFDFDSYNRRGWCRLEQWARISQRSLDNMYLCSDGDFPFVGMSENPELFSMAMDVFRGEFTEDADRYKLVDTVVGLYYLLLQTTKNRQDTASLSPAMKAVLERAASMPDELFPPQYFQDLIHICELVLLHGEADLDLKMLTQSQSLRKSNNIRPYVRTSEKQNAEEIDELTAEESFDRALSTRTQSSERVEKTASEPTGHFHDWNV